MILYGYGKNKCKHQVYSVDDVYTKTAVDDLVYEIQVVTSEDITSTSTQGHDMFTTTVNYPTGFTWSNCTVIAVTEFNKTRKTRRTASTVLYGENYSLVTDVCRVSLMETNDKISLSGRLGGAQTGDVVCYQITLMKTTKAKG